MQHMAWGWQESCKRFTMHQSWRMVLCCLQGQLLQAVSVIGAHHFIRVAILRALRYSLGYSHKTWIFRISRSSVDAISVIRAGHYAFGLMPNIHSCANSVMNLAVALLRFPHPWCCCCDDPPWPEVELPRWQAIRPERHNVPNTQRSSPELSTSIAVPGIREYHCCRGN